MRRYGIFNSRFSKKVRDFSGAGRAAPTGSEACRGCLPRTSSWLFSCGPSGTLRFQNWRGFRGYALVGFGERDDGDAFGWEFDGLLLKGDAFSRG
jgi:hypothetical protein